MYFSCMDLILSPAVHDIRRASLGAPRAPSGLCGPLQGPLMMMWRNLSYPWLNFVPWIQFQPSRFISSDEGLWAYWPHIGSWGPRCPMGPFEDPWVPLEPYVPAMSGPFEPLCSPSKLTIWPRGRLSLFGKLVSDGGGTEETVWPPPMSCPRSSHTPLRRFCVNSLKTVAVFEYYTETQTDLQKFI